MCNLYVCVCVYIYIYIYIYRVSQEECARLWEGVPYIKVYRYNPKLLCPNLNGYGDNGQRKVSSSCGSTHCTCQLTILSISVLECGVIWQQFSSRWPQNCTRTSFNHVTSPLGILMCSAWNPNDNYDMSASVFVVQFNGFMSLTS